MRLTGCAGGKIEIFYEYGQALLAPTRNFFRQGVFVSLPALDRLRERIANAIGGRRAAMAFAKEHPRVAYRTLQNWIDGKTWPDAAELLALAEATGKPLSFFFPDETAQNPEFRSIPLVDAVASTGRGRHLSLIAHKGAITLPADYVRSFAPPDARIVALRCVGDHMAPTIQDGALIIVDESQKQVRSRPPASAAPGDLARRDDIFIFFQGSKLRLARLRDMGKGQVAIASDNDAQHPLELVEPAEDASFALLGKVIWWGSRA